MMRETCLTAKSRVPDFFSDEIVDAPHSAAAAATYTEASAVHARMLSRHHHHYQQQGHKAHQAAAVPRCQVEGCHVELVNAREYYRRHKVCEKHTKAPQVVVLGLDQRFCQQCSRFHLLSEFDDSKRSCRRRLAGHNERRRKPSSHTLLFFSNGFWNEKRDHDGMSPSHQGFSESKKNMMEEACPKENPPDILSSVAPEIGDDVSVPLPPKSREELTIKELTDRVFSSSFSELRELLALKRLDDVILPDYQVQKKKEKEDVIVPSPHKSVKEGMGHTVTHPISKLSESSAPALKCLDDNPEQYRYKIRKEPPEEENMLEESYPQIVKENSPDILSSAARKIVNDTYVPGPRMSNSVACQSLEKQEFLSLCKLPNSSPALEKLDDSPEQCRYKIQKEPQEEKNMMQESYPQAVKKKPPDNLLSTARKIINDIYVPRPLMSNSVACQSLEKQEFISLCKLPNSSPALEKMDDTCNPGLDMPISVACQSLENQEFLSLCKVPNSSAALESLDDICDPGFDTPNSVVCKSLENQGCHSLCKVPNSSAALESLDDIYGHGFDTPISVACQPLEKQESTQPWPIQFGSSSHWCLPDGGQIVQLDSLEQSTNDVAYGAEADQSCPTVSVSDKKTVRKTLKRKCRTMSVSSSEDLQQHFGGRCEDAANIFGVSVSMVKRICRQREIHQWPFRHEKKEAQSINLYWPQPQKLATIKGCSFGEKRPGGGENVEPTGLSLSNFAATNNRGHLVSKDQSGSTASHSEKKNTSKTSTREWITRSVISFENLHQHFGCRHGDAEKGLSVSMFTLKRICRPHAIHWWSYRMENNFSVSTTDALGLRRLSIVKRICRQRGIHWWSFRQKWATMKGRSFGEERSGEVISLSMDEKLD